MTEQKKTRRIRRQLTILEVRSIYEKLINGQSKESIAREFKITTTKVSYIENGGYVKFPKLTPRDLKYKHE